MNVDAIDGGLARSSSTNVRISFVSKTGEPYFTPTNDWTTNFTENDEGMIQDRSFEPAFDPKNEGVAEEEKYAIFYFIDGKLNFKIASTSFRLT